MRDETLDIYARVHNRTDEIMHYLWDPIGVAGAPGARDEYDSYVPTVVRMLFDGATVKAITEYLSSIAYGYMGLSVYEEVDRRTRQAADRLVESYQWLLRQRSE